MFLLVVARAGAGTRLGKVLLRHRCCSTTYNLPVLVVPFTVLLVGRAIAVVCRVLLSY